MKFEDDEIECFKHRNEMEVLRGADQFHNLLRLLKKYASITMEQFRKNTRRELRTHNYSNTDFLSLVKDENRVIDNERYYQIEVYLTMKFTIVIYINKDNAAENRILIKESSASAPVWAYKINPDYCIYISDEQTKKILENQEILRKNVSVYAAFERKLNFFCTSINTLMSETLRKNNFKGDFCGFASANYESAKTDGGLIYLYSESGFEKYPKMKLIPFENFLPAVKEIISDIENEAAEEK